MKDLTCGHDTAQVQGIKNHPRFLVMIPTHRETDGVGKLGQHQAGTCQFYGPNGEMCPKSHCNPGQQL